MDDYREELWQHMYDNDILQSCLTIQRMKDNNCLDITNSRGETSIMHGVRTDAYAVVEILLQNGADMNIQNNSGFSPLMLAITWRGTNYVQLFLDYGADLSLCDQNGWTAIKHASIGNSSQILEMLVQASATDGIDDWTDAIAHALMYKRIENALLLIRHTNDPNGRYGDRDATLLMLALSYDASSCNALGCVKALLEIGADPHIKDMAGWNALDYAKQYCPTAQDIIHEAMRKGDDTCVKWIER